MTSTSRMDGQRRESLSRTVLPTRKLGDALLPERLVLAKKQDMSFEELLLLVRTGGSGVRHSHSRCIARERF